MVEFAHPSPLPMLSVKLRLCCFFSAHYFSFSLNFIFLCAKSQQRKKKNIQNIAEYTLQLMSTGKHDSHIM
jgi:hypothetical protein